MTIPNVPLDQSMTPEVRRYLEAVRREIEATIGDLDAIVVPAKASAAEAATGTDDEKFLTPLSGISTVKTFSPFVNFAYFEDQKSANTVGGAASGGGTYYTRTLNTAVHNSITGASLTSNEVSLPAGTYLIEGMCPAFRVAQHKCRLYNATGSVVIAYGTSEYTAVGSGDLVTTKSIVLTKATFASGTSIRLEHAVGNPTSTSDYGRAANLTGSEVYSTLRIWKLD